MLVIEAKLKGQESHYSKLDEAIRTGQFIQNSCLRYWSDNKGVTRNDLQKLCSKLAKNKETPWANKLNSQAETCLMPIEHGQQFLDSMRIVDWGNLVRKDILNTKNSVVPLNINPRDGSYRLTVSK
ncbi:MAG TPA: hypothetical protein V6D14_22700 [Coleofasciculaceae cyanobacterium]|jgi:hypothetical protein